MKPGLLIVDDEQGIVDTLSMTFEEEFEVVATTVPEGVPALLREHDVAVILADQRMPRMSGVEVLKAARELRPDAVRIVLSAYTETEDLIAAINSGEVWRYLVKPWEPHELRSTVRQAAERFTLGRENQRLHLELELAHEKLKTDYDSLHREVSDKYRFEEILGQSEPMQKVFDLMRRVAGSTITVLIQGETGTGKELIAKAIHFNSPRRQAAFVAQNCGALPDGLLESELFGHKKGSFTGAIADRKGLFEEADGGTVFLDEIPETSAAMQVRLLRVLQEGEVRRVGDTDNRRVDVRVIAATNQDLAALVREGKFREDLFYRLNVVTITLPPLRDRPDDILLLAHHFLDKYCRKFGRSVTRISEPAAALLRSYPFPGNVRELENEIERAVMMTDGDTITPESLTDKMLRGTAALPADAPAGGLIAAVDALKRRLIDEALRSEDGNKTRAATRLGLTRQSLQQMMKRLQMED